MLDSAVLLETFGLVNVIRLAVNDDYARIKISPVRIEVVGRRHDDAGFDFLRFKEFIEAGLIHDSWQEG